MKPMSPHSNVLHTQISSFSPQNDRNSNRSLSKMMRTGTCLLLGLMLGMAGCKDQNDTSETASLSEMGEKLNKLIPKGTPLKTAEEEMLKQGFLCERLLNAKWKNKPHVNYIHCKREDGTPPIKLLWDIAVIHDGAVVEGVDIRRAFVYP
jgi:hypothetical protein